ncbi:MAG: trigger factor [Epsilonproteobacteria bacterium]|nr:trigger factor [Campylobacterota bacterium]
MEIDAKKIDSANAKVEAKVSKEEVGKEEDKIAKKIAKDIKIDGFRKGKAPASVVKKLYKNNIEQDSIAQIFQKLLEESLEKLGMDKNDMLGEPSVKKFDKKDDGSIEIEFEISFKPTIDTAVIKECLPEYKTPRVTKKEIEERINQMLKSVAETKEVEEDREVKEGDVVNIDFKGFVDGKAFQGGEAKGYELEIGSGSFIPGFEEGIVGMKKGETKEIKVTFPKDYPNAELAGKEAAFEVKLNGIKEKILPSADDEKVLKTFLPDVENPTKEELEKRIKQQIKQEKLNKLYLDELKPKLTENITKKFEFDLPKTVVDQEVEMSFRNSLQSKSDEEIKELQENPDKVDELRKSFEEGAKESVKLTFVVDELARQENIEVDDNEVVQAIYYEAMQQGQDPKKYLEYYQKQNLLPAIKMAMVEDKLFVKLLNLEDNK